MPVKVLNGYEHERQRVVDLLDGFRGYVPADQAALLRSIADDLEKKPRLIIVENIPAPDGRSNRTPDSIRQRRSRALKDAGFRALRGSAYVNDMSLSVLVQHGVLDIATTENDLDLLDALTLHLPDRLAWQ